MNSIGEMKIHDILLQNGIPFKEEYEFFNLKGFKNKPLRFDFAIFDDEWNLEFLIEYQGIQHYKPVEKFGGIKELKKQQFYDMKKREYCKKNRIKLVIIPYWDYNRITYDYIMKAANYLI